MSKGLYPVEFKGKKWKEKDCNDIFVAYYYDEFSLDGAKSVYVSNDDRIQPDGTWI